MDKKGVFPSGLIQLAVDSLGAAHFEYVDTRVKPKPTPGMFTLNLAAVGIDRPYAEQLEIAEVGAKKARGTVSAVTGFGKSIAMALLVARLQLRTLIIVPNLGLKEQLRATFTAVFGSLHNVLIENIDSPRLKTTPDFDCLIIDEAHHSAAATYRKLNTSAWTGIYTRFFFTATPFRARSAEDILLESIAGQIIYRVSYETAVERGYICPIDAYYYVLPKKRALKGNGKSWPGVYSELIVKNAERNALLARLITSLYEQKQSTLCLVKEVAHGEELARLTGAAFAHGQGEDHQQLIEWFAAGKLRTLIATVGVCSEGRDTKSAEWVILGQGGQSKNQLMQAIGRGVRRFGEKESCKVVLFDEPSHRWTHDHWKAQVRAIEEEYGIRPTRLDLPEDL